MIAQTVLASAQLFGSACTFVLEADKRCHDCVYGALFGLEPLSQKRAAPHQPRPSRNGTPVSTCRRMEPSPTSHCD
eukprot:6198760-Pleurochrysis_carterae.AAC.1